MARTSRIRELLVGRVHFGSLSALQLLNLSTPSTLSFMHLHLPRRHRRKLLFPPGLLALAGLLWLGCVAVRSWQEQLKPRYVIRFTMPTRPPANWPQPTIRWVIPSPDTLLKQGSWHEATLTGNDANDSFQQQHIIEELRAIIADKIGRAHV